MTTPWFIVAIITIFWLSIQAKNKQHPLSDKFIKNINTKQNLWKAGRNFPKKISFEHIKRLMGVLPNNDKVGLPQMIHRAELIDSLPENFDPRQKWPNCFTLNEIRDQGSCGSCWAFGAVEAMTDRVCIYSNGTEQFHFSANDLLSCCNFCGFGCNGGIPASAWSYYKDSGIVSGGNYNSSEGCRPYEIPECEYHVHGKRKPCEEIVPTPQCSTSCKSRYNIQYDKDKRYAKQVYYIDGEDHIKAELFKNGPVEASFTVYTDFLNYKSGIYKNVDGKQIGHHAVKMIGWGINNGTKYWLIANSWNSNWGDKGYFKILRGENHCNIESDIYAGEPLLINDNN